MCLAAGLVLSEDHEGVVIAGILPSGAAGQDRRFQIGDIVEKVDHNRVRNISEAKRLLLGDLGTPVDIKLKRSQSREPTWNLRTGLLQHLPGKSICMTLRIKRQSKLGVLDAVQLTQCAELFFAYQEELCSISGGRKSNRAIAHLFEDEDFPGRETFPARFNLVEGELERLLERSSRTLGFSLSPKILRTPEIQDHHQEIALACVMASHTRLGRRCTLLHGLPAVLLRWVVELALARPWNMFRRDADFHDFVWLVAQHFQVNEPVPPADNLRDKVWYPRL